MSDYLFDGKGSDPEVEALEQSLSKLAHEAPLGSLPARPRSFRPTRVGLVVGVFALAAACVLAIVFYPRPEPVESEVAEREAEPQSEPAVELQSRPARPTHQASDSRVRAVPCVATAPRPRQVCSPSAHGSRPDLRTRPNSPWPTSVH